MSSRVLGLPREAAGTPARSVSAALGRRLTAVALDGVIVATMVIAAGLCAHLVLLLRSREAASEEPAVLLVLAGLITAAYFVSSWGLDGETFGQRLMNLRVARTSAPERSEPIGVGRALRRLAGCVLGVGALDVVVSLVRSDGRSLHDVIADTVVVRRAGSVASSGVDRPLRTVHKGRKYA